MLADKPIKNENQFENWLHNALIRHKCFMVKVPDILFDKKVFAALAKQNIKIAAHKRPYDVIITTPNAVYQVELKYEGRPYKDHQVWNINKINSVKPFSAFGLRYYKTKMVVDYISEKHSVESVKELIELINLKSG